MEALAMRAVLIGCLWLVAIGLTLAQETPIQAGDKIRVTVEGEDSLSRVYAVDAQGNLQMPLIGTLKASGKLPSALAEAIRQRLIEGQFLRDPKVRVEVVQPMRATVSVTGAVRRAGEFEIKPNWRVNDAILQADPANVADLSAIRLERADGTKLTLNLLRYRQSGDESQNPLLQAGDRIFVPLVPNNRNVMVLGAVNRPGTYDYLEAPTLQQALRLAGGTQTEADLTQVTIKRLDMADPIVINLRTVSGDMPLQPGDQITVPFQRVKQFLVVRGGVPQPGIHTYIEGMTLTQAIELAGGPTDKAILEKVTITRPVAGGHTQKITVNLLEVAQGLRPDEPLKAGDTVEVPVVRERRSSPEEPLRVVWLLLSIIYLITRR
ncbi:MAG: hypothetical protein C4336_07550 [Armatimonadota bacterium]